MNTFKAIWSNFNPGKLPAAVILLSVVIILTFTYSMLNFNLLLDTGGDNARYILLGRSILQGKFMHETYTPTSQLHRTYPPMFPLILSFIMLIFGRENIFAMKMFSVLCYTASMGILFLILIRTVKDKTAAFLSAILAMLIYHGVQLSSLILTESLFTLYVVLFIYFSIRYDETEKISFLLALLSVSVLAVYTRGNGILFIAAAGAYLLLKKRWKLLLTAVLPALVISQLWSVYVFAETGQGSDYFRQLLLKNNYLPHLGYIGAVELLQRIKLNAFTYLFAIIPAFLMPMYINIPVSFIMIFGANILLFSGLFFSFFFGEILIPVFMLLNGALLLFWPENFTTERFLVPFIPVIIILFSYVFRFLFKFRNMKLAVYPFLSVFIILNIIFGLNYIPLKMMTFRDGDKKDFRKNFIFYSAGVFNFYDIAIWAKNNTNPNDNFTSVKPELFTLFSDRKCVIFPYTSEREECMEFFIANNIKYALFENTEKEKITTLTLNEFILDNAEHFEIAYKSRDVERYMLLRVIEQF